MVLQTRAASSNTSACVESEDDALSYMSGPENDPSLASGKPDITAMVKATMADVPKAALRFKVTVPKIVEKQASERAKRQAAKQKKDQSKQKATTKGKNAITKKATPSSSKRKVLGDVSESDTGDVQEEVQPRKKAKPSVKEDDEDVVEAQEMYEITAYILVEKTLPPPQRGSRAAKVAEADKYLQRGPFKFKSTDSYSTFLVAISNALPCPVLNILQDKITWKPQSPKNATALLLGGATGYPALIETFRNKKPAIVMLTMPPPSKPADKPEWDTGEGKQTDKEFDYSNLELPSTGQHVVEQRIQFDKAVGPFKQELLAKYPIGNNALFPQKRIYADKMGSYWDLTDLRIGVWASHLARGTATLDSPPISNQFDQAGRIHPPRASTASIPREAAAPTIALTPTALAAAAIPAPAPAPALAATLTPAPATTAATPSLMELIMINMLQQQLSSSNANRLGTSAIAFPPSAALPPATASALAIVPDISHEPAEPRRAIPNIELTAFCSRYAIDDVDRKRLEKLEFRPGDDIEQLSPAEWRDFAGFLQLSWSRIIRKNKDFLLDIKAGVWKDN
ncbi:unnamed protein product [Cyclocybe aegerita]|uniref:Uncharacterized protein n=1 Tax=Cyclocybe aegerita TaxID=1973307 RepID=A0A8S0W9L1_CYCAE|nr:unnamed protein product [Cyclocybe aegerita]